MRSRTETTVALILRASRKPVAAAASAAMIATRMTAFLPLP
jgi:hypothetical protein